MANTHADLNSLFTAMADAIREKTNSTEEIVADNFPTEIENLRTGFDYSNHNVTAIPDYAFYGCEELNNVDCCNLTSIGESAFEGCKNLKSVILYDSVETVGKNAFKGCGDVEINCMLDEQPETWDENWNPDGCEVVTLEPIETWDVSATENDNVTARLYSDMQNDGMYLLVIGGNGSMRNYTTNASNPWFDYNGNISCVIFNGEINIGGNVSCANENTSLIIRSGVASIGDKAFYRSKFSSVQIPDSVTSIGEYAFYGCYNLASVTIGGGVTNIGFGAFISCSIDTVCIEDLMTYCNATLGHTYLFEDASKLYVHGEPVSRLIIPGDVNSIADQAFCECKVITEVDIAVGVKSIGWNTFRECSKLASVILPDSLTNIEKYAFYDCSNITDINYAGTISQWNMIAFGDNWNGNTGNYTIHCTDGDIAKDGTITYHTTT